jgi:hypothetical protein
MVMMQRPLGRPLETDEADARSNRHLTILARCGATKLTDLSYLPSEMIRLRNRADMLHSPRRWLKAINRGEFATSGVGVCAVSGL